jgi:Xaa-Pro aminopeptidase
MFADRGLEPLEAREQARQGAVQAALSLQPMSADRDFALVRALRDLGLDRGRLALDDAALGGDLAATGLAVTLVPAAQTMSRLRLVKSPREIELMRIAASANGEAAMAAAQALREGATLREFRTLVFAEAARRGNRGVFMVIDGVGAEGADATLREGQALMFDAVSEGAGYHGDFARTLFVGEPAATMKQVTAAIELGWAAVREALRPGLRYSEITTIGREAVRRAGYDFFILFQPHSCGLYHSDATGLGDVVLEPGMVLSVDCPVMEAGIGGTAHLEDLMLITRDGAEPLHGVPGPILTV